MKPLIVSAVLFESESLQQLSGDTFDYYECGIGSINAAQKSVELARLAAGRHVIFTGSCGTFATFAEPYLVTTTTTLWLPTAYRTGDAYGVQGQDLPLSWSDRVSTIASDLPQVTTICSPGISRTNILADDFKKDQHVENLELYAVAAPLLKSCRQLDVIFGVTNAIGPDAHQQWKKHFRATAEMAAEYIWRRFGEMEHN